MLGIGERKAVVKTVVPDLVRVLRTQIVVQAVPEVEVDAAKMKGPEIEVGQDAQGREEPREPSPPARAGAIRPRR